MMSKIDNVAEGLYTIADAITEASNPEDTHLGYEVKQLTGAANMIADAILPLNSTGITDDAGVFVNSLTEAVMGVTAGLIRVASALEDIAAAIDRKE
jgi:hypothetical protein